MINKPPTDDFFFFFFEENSSRAVADFSARMRFYTPTRKSWRDDNGIHKSHLTKRRDFFDAKPQSCNNYIKQIGEGCGYRYYDKITKACAYLNSAGMYDSLSRINMLYIFSFILPWPARSVSLTFYENRLSMNTIIAHRKSVYYGFIRRCSKKKKRYKERKK